jgi:hypothetical protein
VVDFIGVRNVGLGFKVWGDDDSILSKSNGGEQPLSIV